MDKIDNLLSDLENPRLHVQVETVEEYFKLPKKERTRWNFWYLPPNYLPWTECIESENDGGWGEFYVRIKKEYPVQYFLRETIWNNINIKFYRTKNKLENWYIYLFNPQHSELRKVIPRNWLDLDGIIIEFLFACIISYVEKEGGLKGFELLKEDKKKADKLKGRRISKEERAALNKDFGWGGVKQFNSYYEVQYPIYAKINEIYQYATVTRKKYKECWDKGEGFTDIDGVVYEWEDVDKFLSEKDDFYSKMVVELKGYLWT